jgi:transposase-like protein
MEAQDYRAFVEQLNELTSSQRAALIAALKTRGAVDEVIATIEMGFAAAPSCGHCRSGRFVSWGHATGMRRYKCKDCERTFNALTGTPLGHLHCREKWLDYARALIDGVSLRNAAERCDINLTTSFRWRHRFLKAPKGTKAPAVTGIVEADETFIRKSAKGMRQLKGRAPRKRGTKATKAVRSTMEHDAVLIVRDRHGATTDAVLPDLMAATFEAVLMPIVAKDAVLVSDGCHAYGRFAQAANIVHFVLTARRGMRVRAGFHIQNVNAYTSRLKGWLARFRGVASRHLPTYLGWRRMIEREGSRLTPHHCLALAIG